MAVFGRTRTFKILTLLFMLFIQKIWVFFINHYFSHLVFGFATYMYAIHNNISKNQFFNTSTITKASYSEANGCHSNNLKIIFYH